MAFIRPPPKRPTGLQRMAATGKKRVSKRLQKKIKRDIYGRLSRLYAKEERLIERREELLHKSKDMPEIRFPGFKMKPKTQMAHQEILQALQEGMIPRKFLKLHGIRKLLSNPTAFKELFNLLYKYYTGQIKKPEWDKLEKVLTKAIREGMAKDIGARGSKTGRIRVENEISKIEQQFAHLRQMG